LDDLLELARRTGKQVRVGFNHRYHPAMLKAKALISDGAIGELMFVRARYGHGGRAGYDREWRADPRLSGGGELIDQGVHIIDLARWFLGDFAEVTGSIHTYFWDMPVDDNAFLCLRTAAGRVAWLHASCTEWKNTFSFEVFGKSGKVHVEGLGGSYGIERINLYERPPQGGVPETTTWEFPGPDTSWSVEFEEFLEDIAAARTPSAGLLEARAALRVVEQLYTQHATAAP
jgi:predicted dehydrogenase